MFYQMKLKKTFRFINDFLEITYQSRCILSGPPCIVLTFTLVKIESCAVIQTLSTNLQAVKISSSNSGPESLVK